jgi:hypothetical protein
MPSSAGSVSSSLASEIPGARRETRDGALAQQPQPGQRPLAIAGHPVRQHRNRRRLPRPRPSALRTLNVDTPLATAICRSVAPAASSPAIRSTSCRVSFEAPSAHGGPASARPSPPVASA